MSQPDFMEAINRARQAAEKLQQQKRSMDSFAGDDSAKKSRSDGSNDGLPPGYPPLRSDPSPQNSNNSGADPLAKVKEVAARLNQQVAALKGGPVAPVGGGGGGGMMPGLPLPPSDGNTVTDEFWVPERLVGLVIGKGGETISRLQLESGAHMQVDQINVGGPERKCTLSGSKECVDKIKGLLRQLIDRARAIDAGGGTGGGGGGGGMGGRLGGITEEMIIPGTLVGVIIGKGGEQIKQIQEQYGVKMVLIQDSHDPTPQPKPLKITGDPEKVRAAKEVVQRILAQKEEQDRGRRPGGGRNVGEYGSGDAGAGRNGSSGYRQARVEVPSTIVGGIIGKNGEMIKRISADFGSLKMQFATDTDPSLGYKVLEIGPGPAETADQCATVVRKLVEGLMQAKVSGQRGTTDGMSMYESIRQELVSTGRFTAPQLPSFSGPDPSKMGPYETAEVVFTIPFRKAGYVIGKGGSTIHEIMNESGAHMEVVRDPNEKDMMSRGQTPESKTFRIRGTASQIDSALRIITTKADVPPPPGWCQQPQDLASLYAYSLATHGTADAAAAAVAAAAAAAADPTGYWYQQMMQQQQQPQQAQQQQQPQQSGQMPGAPGGDMQQGGSYPSPSMNPATGQLDYSEAWAQYYRSLGQHEYADMIIQQARAQREGGGAQPDGNGSAQAGPQQYQR